MRGELPSQEQTTCSGNSRCNSVCLLARIEWNHRGQPKTSARRSSRVISVRRFEFFQPIAVLAAAQYCGAATTYSLLSPKISNASRGTNSLTFTELFCVFTLRNGFSSMLFQSTASCMTAHLADGFNLSSEFQRNGVREYIAKPCPWVTRAIFLTR